MDTLEEEAHKTTCTSYMRHSMWGTYLERYRDRRVSTTSAASEQLLVPLWSFPCLFLSCCTGGRYRRGMGWSSTAGPLSSITQKREGVGWSSMAGPLSITCTEGGVGWSSTAGPFSSITQRRGSLHTNTPLVGGGWGFPHSISPSSWLMTSIPSPSPLLPSPQSCGR